MSFPVNIDLLGGTGYRDYPAIPRRYHTRFKIWVFSKGEAGGEVRRNGVAPEGADDVVSEVIASHRVWEVPETILTIAAAKSVPQPRILDVGAQIGWFSMLVLANGGTADAIDGNPAALELLQKSMMDTAPAGGSLITTPEMIEDGWGHQPVFPGGQGTTILKIDVEGNEHYALEGTSGLWQGQLVAHIQMEVSPVFHDGYPAMLWDLKKAGYEIWETPPKTQPPVVVHTAAEYLRHSGKRLDNMTRKTLTSYVNDQHQFNVWCLSDHASFA